MGNLPIKLRAHPAHDDDVLRKLEQAVPVAMLTMREAWEGPKTGNRCNSSADAVLMSMRLSLFGGRLKPRLAAALK